ncbi:MAG: AAA family ATPase [Ruminococcus sp.]|uniref:ATP-dependent nuclease n=1 Tax=Ruminococcus sp. TaxID=41978 RepID=UPI0025F715E4|nr:AAA family ATPase [Ruminococcus sp.]MCR5541120.1 AAA family ATPase [Ruminococcus sp.]
MKLEYNINKLIKSIGQAYNDDKFVNYIKYIQFPFYKCLTPNTHIDFSFPLTMLVGKNGTGKSSILQAIYGAPKGKSTGDYWFSTSVDPIKENKNKYFYGYSRESADGVIIKEVIKTRQNSGKDPDYWETDRLNTSLGMKPDDNLDKETRNDPVNKNVVYFDFRGELSAFDKYFYFHKTQNDSNSKIYEINRKEAKQYVRKRSKYLTRIVNGEKNVKLRNNSEVIHEQLNIINASSHHDWLDIINYILGKNYSEIKYVYHRAYETWGISTVVKTESGLQYSEANAGSGENAIINMVVAIMSAKPNSLILLDEPEVSLHPGAQKRLKIFLLNSIEKNHHQIIISTHSSVLIEDMPKNALKLLECNNNGTVDVSNEVFFNEAFFNINEQITDKALILCEDISAKILIEKILREMGKEDYFNVQYRHGGADTLITKHFPILALDQIYNNVFIILDGDKMPENLIKYSKDVTATEIDDVEVLNNYVNNNIAKLPKNAVINPLVDGGNGGVREDQKIEVYREYLKYAEHHLLFLPKDMTPEMIMLSDSSVKEEYSITDEDIYSEDKGKKAVNSISRNEIGDTELNSLESTYKKLINKHFRSNDPEENENYNAVIQTLQSVYNYHNSSERQLVASH